MTADAPSLRQLRAPGSVLGAAAGMGHLSGVLAAGPRAASCPPAEQAWALVQASGPGQP